MPTSSSTSTSTFTDDGVALAWGAWTEFGASGWTATHEDWAIDPEPLIVFTAFLGDRDPRLRDESTDWCIRNWRHVSKTRLKNLVASQPPHAQYTFGTFAATVNAHAGITWPHGSAPRHFTPTGRSSAPRLERPSMAWLRLRAMFGLGARAEILRYFLTPPGSPASVAEIAGAIAYTKRNVADECDLLADAGMLAVRTLGNRYQYSLARRGELEALVGPLPAIRPDFPALLTVARVLIELEADAATSTPRTLAVKARKSLDEVAPALDSLDVELPLASGSGLWPAVQDLGGRTLRAWSTGQWHEAE